MDVSCQFPVYLNLGICHRSFENDGDFFILPTCWHGKGMAVNSFFVVKPKALAITNVITSVIILSNALLLPLSGSSNLRPITSIFTSGYQKIPIYLLFIIDSGKILYFFYRLRRSVEGNA